MNITRHGTRGASQVPGNYFTGPVRVESHVLEPRTRSETSRHSPAATFSWMAV